MENRDELCFPHLLNSSCLKPKLHQSTSLFLNFMLFISFITAVLNLLVIISISHFRQLHMPTNTILLSLAVSDFLVGCFLMPLDIFRISSCWFFGDITCSLLYYMTCHVISTSVGNMVFVSVDRYIAICDPLHYPTRITLVKVKCGVCMCWLSAASCSFLYVKDEMIQLGSTRSCFGECTYAVSFIVVTVGLIVNFLLPVTVIIVLYMRVFVVAVSQARAMRSHITTTTLQKSGNVKTKKSELKAARTLGVLVFVFLLCFCPYYCVSLGGNILPDAANIIYLFYFNSCLNPVIYTLFYPWFRKAIKLIVTLQILRPDSCEAKILQ